MLHRPEQLVARRLAIGQRAVFVTVAETSEVDDGGELNMERDLAQTLQRVGESLQVDVENPRQFVQHHLLCCSGHHEVSGLFLRFTR